MFSENLAALGERRSGRKPCKQAIYGHKIKTLMLISSVSKLAFLYGGDEGDRTPYLLNAIQALSQMSYTPKTTLRIINPSG